MTGTVAFSVTRRMSASPPRGTTRSTSPLCVTRKSMASWSGLSTYWTAFASIPAAARPFWMQRTRAALDSRASLPPRRMEALPDFRHRAAVSTVTFGRDS